MGLKRSPADEAFSKCVRERANYCCERCGKGYDASSTGLHCSHHFSRRHRSIRWCGDNAMALCYACHEWYGGNPADSGAWLRGVASHVNDIRRPEFLVGMKLNLPPSYLLIHRVWLGGIGALPVMSGGWLVRWP